jgi:hypothetical protein
LRSRWSSVVHFSSNPTSHFVPPGPIQLSLRSRWASAVHCPRTSATLSVPACWNNYHWDLGESVLDTVNTPVQRSCSQHNSNCTRSSCSNGQRQVVSSCPLPLGLSSRSFSGWSSCHPPNSCTSPHQGGLPEL